MPTPAERIRALNDALRQRGVGGEIFVTRGIADLRPELRVQAIARVREFDDFTPENDPYGEHDFGAIKIGGTRLLFKIDYYDRARQFGSPDPADPAVTCRVLTIMLAEEY